MKPLDIGNSYNQITHIWENEKFDKTNGIIQHKKAINFAKNRGKALDIGCGCTGRFIDLLIDEGFTPSGIDISTKMIELAKKRHPSIDFYYGDICEYELSEKYDFITAWDSIWHIPLSKQEKVIAKIIDSLNVGGIFIFSFGGTIDSGEHIDDYMGAEVYYSSLGINGFLKCFLDLGCIIRHLEFDQYPELHTYLIVEKA
ncbi:MAG: class I SAM-dependent methyltransferase [Arcobacter sp.]|jgi:2-polyprenyl-3-methyl-5-hydroxy-6-metoxy-1,4-benzoquinol methylase|nr:class I SAM-dependent methyltransferase [Arcobacter sp.]